MIIKIMLIWYLLLVSAGFLSTSTVAYYSDQKQAHGSLTIGTWKSEESEQQKEETEKEIERAKENGEEQEIQSESGEHTNE
ncbi:SipW-dependent-type signal peptide-containing protein [Metabacillus niabensis]|uniref:SipW-dependent-type signal peptide-containing protein n=1 Tax=Metabacillus niabensis TaxID=324854 RepID=UPI001CFAC1D5|nr:SipW-dependent-type signal peptide-containing protein [Metabacillus niabensis]